ncbi:MAG: acetate--CoA ligase family protein [Elusimicrobiota bacterium]|jgi:acyl-CoA synthetase (NDP forming)
MNTTTSAAKKDALAVIETALKKASAEGRKALSEVEVYAVFDALGLDTPGRTVLPLSRIPSGPALDKELSSIPGERLVLKISSHKVLHKTEAGGVRVCARADAAQALAQMARSFPEGEGILVCEFVEHAAFSLGQELMLGARADAGFGPLLTLGVGGTDAEQLTSKLKPGTSPAVMPLGLSQECGGWNTFLQDSWVWKYVSGDIRGGKRLAEDAVMLRWIEGFNRLLSKFDGKASPFLIEEVEVNPLAVSRGRIVALDGVLRFKKACLAERERPSAKGVMALLQPKTVAVAGVSEQKMNMGRIILRNVAEAGFPKEKLFVLKDFAGEIEGARCCAAPADFPEPIDMLVVAVPSPEVPALLEASAKSGKVRGIVLISGGMGEKSGSEGVKERVLQVIKDGRKINPDFAVSGGNSLGIVSAPSKVNTFFIPKSKLQMPTVEDGAHARAAFISQSGAFVISVVSRMPWLKPAYCVSVGNQMDVTVPDYVEQAAKDPSIKVLLVYLEGLQPGDGLRLARSIREARKQGKTVVVYKAGRTPTGQKAVMGHTASIAGDHVVTSSVFARAGALVAETFDDFDDLSQISCFCADFPSLGPGLFAMSNAGFETAGMADSILPDGPIQAAALDEKTTRRMEELLREGKLDGIVDVRNPLDVTPMAGDAPILKLSEAALRSACVDAVLVAMIPLTPAMKTLPEEGLEESVPVRLGTLAKTARKPVLFCVASGTLYDPYARLAQDQGLPVFRAADRALRAYARARAARQGKQ